MESRRNLSEFHSTSFRRLYEYNWSAIITHKLDFIAVDSDSHLLLDALQVEL